MNGEPKKTRITEIYQIKKLYWPTWDGYDSPEETILANYIDREQAEKRLQKLKEENEIKKKALEEAGQKGYWNKFEHYEYRMEILRIDYD